MSELDLVPDCGHCAAVCCTALSFDASEYFAFSKPAGVTCRHVARDHRCAIHETLADRGFAGCAAYTCFGAGQRTTREFGGSQDAFHLLREAHELLWLLTEARRRYPDHATGLDLEIARLESYRPGDRLDPAPARAALRHLGRRLHVL